MPGHQIAGVVAGTGEGAGRFSPGDRVGVPWLGWTDGECRYCRAGRENLCDNARFTGYDLDGGYAELAVADERFCLPLPEGYTDERAAPLLCAGLIGYRALRLVGDAERIGFYGFGASAHILCQIAVDQGRRVFAFTREGDAETQEFARGLGAEWAGSSEEQPPEELDGAIVFAAVGALMPAALRASAKGARVISAGIHMSEIPSFPYELLWEERALGSVANLTRADGEEFMRARVPGARPHRDQRLPPGGGELRPRGPARRPLPRRRRPHDRRCLAFPTLASLIVVVRPIFLTFPAVSRTVSLI